MSTPSTDIDHVLKSLASESIKQGGNVRAAVRDLTLNAMQQRELTLDQIRKVLRSVAVGVNLGVADREVKVEKALADTVAGMDDALLKAVAGEQRGAPPVDGGGLRLRRLQPEAGARRIGRLEDAMSSRASRARRKARARRSRRRGSGC